MNIRNFTSDEIAEINNYVLTQIPQTILPSLFLITEEPIKKTRAFVAIYRILNSCKDFIENEKTREKLAEHLNYSHKSYTKFYEIILKYDLTELDLRKKMLENSIIDSLKLYNNQVNYCINTFLVFAEKMELINTNTVSGIKLEESTGKDLYDNIAKNVED